MKLEDVKENVVYQCVDVLWFVDEHADLLRVSIEDGLDESRLQAKKKKRH